MVRVNEAELDASSNNGYGCGLYRETNKTKNDTIGILETSLRFPQDADKSARGENISDNGANQPYAGYQISDVTKRANVCSLGVYKFRKGK